MPSDNRNEMSDSAAIALAHLGMIVQIATGSHRAAPGEIEKRAGAIGAYIRTGQLLAADEDRELIASIKGFLARRTISDLLPAGEFTDANISASETVTGEPGRRRRG